MTINNSATTHKLTYMIGASSGTTLVDERLCLLPEYNQAVDKLLWEDGPLSIAENAYRQIKQQLGGEISAHYIKSFR